MTRVYQAAQIGTLLREDSRTLVEKYGKVVAPFFRLEISDQSDQIIFSADSQLRESSYDLNGLIVSDISWDENDCQADELKMTVQNIDLTLHDSRLFAEGNSIDLWMGYDGHQPEYMGRAIVVEVESVFTSDAIPTIEITAYDISHFMSEEGRAEIEQEGTQWWERHTVTTETVPQEVPVLNAVPNTASDAAVARRRAAAVGVSPDIIPSPSLEEGAATPANTPITAVMGTVTHDTATPRSRTIFRQSRTNRGRRNNRGKVWRNLRDDEIAIAIFHSYGIVPFVEATNQRARARKVATTDERTGQIVTSQVRNLTSDQQRDMRQAEQAGITGIVPIETVERDMESGELGLHNREIRAQASTQVVEGMQIVGGRRVVQKSGTSDWEFLKKLAATHDWIVFVFYFYDTRNWIGYFGPKRYIPQHVSYTFEYAANDDTTLAEFRPKISTKGQKTDIDLMYVDPVSRRQNRMRVSMENISRYTPEFRGPDGTRDIQEPLGNGPEIVLTVSGQRSVVTANRRFANMDDARRWLMAFWIRYASEFCEADGNIIIGLPEIHARHKHVVNGVGRFGGAYFFTKVSHKMATGSIYETTFTGYRVVDLIDHEPISDDSSISVESNDLGVLTPEVRDVLTRWQEALAVP